MKAPGIGLLSGVVDACSRIAGRRPGVEDATRVLTFQDGRLHILTRGLRGPRAGQIAERVERGLTAHAAVRWAVVNTALEAAVIALDGGPDVDIALMNELLEIVAEVERGHDVDAEPLPSSHPGTSRPGAKALVSLAMQVVALPVATVGRVVRFAPLPPEIAAIITEIDYEPRLRGLADAVVGQENVTVLIATLNAFFQAGAGGILGLTVDALRHGLRVAEGGAARTAWQTAEPEMTGARERAVSGPAPRVPAREVPLRDGPVERYAARAAYVAGAGFAGVFGISRRPRSAAAAALAAIPKAPLLAREGFACALSTGLHVRGTPVHITQALRRLDRIDTLVLDTSALTEGAYRLADLVPLDDEASAGRAGQLAATGHRLFDAHAPERFATADGWRLGPLDGPGAGGRAVKRAAASLAEDDAHLLGLAEGERLVAVIKAVPEVPDAARLLVDAAHRSRLRVVARGPRARTVVPGADDFAPDGEETAATVRRLQTRGRGVLLVSADRLALACADVGVGVASQDGVPAWGAHVYAASAREALLLAEACGPARTLARRSVRFAQAAAAVGSMTALAGQDGRPTARSMAAVNWAALLGIAHGVWTAVELLRRPPDPSPTREPWHAMPAETVLAHTGSREKGLTEAEAAGRPASGQDGPARLSLVRSVAAELANPLTPVLLGGGVLSAAVGGIVDAAIIGGVTLLSGLIGGTQRHVAEREVHRLQRESQVTGRVVRDEQERRMPADDLVVGDVIRLRGGDVVPADCRLTDTQDMEVDESALTGESVPVTKDSDPVIAAEIADRSCMVYEGTTIAAGHGTAVVVAIGADTEAGRSARAARGVAPAVGVERRLARITRTTLPVAVGSAVAVMAAGFLHGRAVRESVGAGVALAVASVPEGLPFLVSAAQLAASRRLAAQGVLVRDPRTIEAAGRTDVLCFDKTGTLTRGRIELTAVEADGDIGALPHLRRAERAVLAAALRATPQGRAGRPPEHYTDRAVIEGARRAAVPRTHGATAWRAGSHLPFEPSRGFHATRGRTGRRRLLSVKGAPEEVVGRCATHHGRPADAARLLARGEELASAGYRVLAVAEGSAPGGKLHEDAVHDLEFLGFLLLRDEVRTGAGPSVRRLADAGVQIVMITGDHPQTAEAVARELKVLDGHGVVTGAELDQLDDDALDTLLPSVGVVARSTPAHKVRVVRSFQRLGRTVAMTGDGSNDAPAIRLADIGIALGERATPAARAAADLVVTDGRLETILATLIEGRAMWASVRQALAVLVGGNLGEIGFTLVGSTISGISPLTARQLLLVNLFTDLAPAVAVALRRPEPSTTERPLREGPEESLGAALTHEITVRAIATAAGAGAAWVAGRVTGRPARARTIALAALVGTQLAQTLLVGGRSRAVIGCVVASVLALVAVVQTPGVSHFFGCVPLGPIAWATALACAVAATVASVLLDPAASPLRSGAGERGSPRPRRDRSPATAAAR